MSSKLVDELKSFKTLWERGYFEGDPLNPLATSGYRQLGFMSVLHATFLRCIKPYVNAHTVSLEIGPGRGAWTKALLLSKEVFVLDALSAEHNKFFEYLEHPPHVTYIQVKDFECKMLPDNYFNFMFSFGCLCHVSFDGMTQYALNLYPKLKEGSNCFWMVADYEKYNHAVSNLDRLSIWNVFMPKPRRYLPLKMILKYFKNRQEVQYRKQLKCKKMDENSAPSPGRWYHAGIERTCSMLQEVGYNIIDSDVGTCLRDPIIHFMKS